MLVKKLPPRNVDALKFEMDNLMTASNLGAVISPSMIWKHPSCTSNSNSYLSHAHQMSKAVELLIKHAFVSCLDCC
ncbi:unnamed protein product [Gongylonema pulchrum]|uniref:Rho-GAP domain-containing protein n=1 Tax=Gongylonema pulchrum TaxID=637853 RepID=A0A3P7NQJ6_9BILA|nr:unnamed protein product [Gongylonema pulchrum]